MRQTPPSKDSSILVIDDDVNYPRIMGEALEAAQIPAKLNWVDDGETALNQLEAKVRNGDRVHLPSLILLDINIPGMTGFEILRHVRESKELQSIPVVMLSVSQSGSDIERSYSLGANAYITKPTDFKKLQDMLHSIYEFF